MPLDLAFKKPALNKPNAAGFTPSGISLYYRLGATWRFNEENIATKATPGGSDMHKDRHTD